MKHLSSTCCARLSQWWIVNGTVWLRWFQKLPFCYKCYKWNAFSTFIFSSRDGKQLCQSEKTPKEVSFSAWRECFSFAWRVVKQPIVAQWKKNHIQSKRTANIAERRDFMLLSKHKLTAILLWRYIHQENVLKICYIRSSYLCSLSSRLPLCP